MDGRDIGTTVLPHAALKILYGSFGCRNAQTAATRKTFKRELKRHLPRWKQEIAERDRKDSQRKVSPLRQAADAIRIDTTSQ